MRFPWGSRSGSGAPRRFGMPSARPGARGRRGRIASTVVVALAATALGVAAASSQGSMVHQADLGDSGIWLTSDVLAKYGRFNTQARQMDAGVAVDVAPGSAIDVLQDGAAVLAWTIGSAKLQAIDPRAGTTTNAATVVPAPSAPKAGVVPGTVVDLRGGTVALVDAKTGKVWAQRVDSRGGITDLTKLAATVKPLTTVGGAASVAVGEDGAVHVVSGEKAAVTTLTPHGEGFADPVTVSTHAKGDSLQISALGASWVVYDARTDRLFSADHADGVGVGLATDSEHAAYAALQVPGPTADAAAIAGPNAVRMVRLDGGTTTGGVEIQERVNRSATQPLIAAPVVVRGCVHGAWKETGHVFYGANCGVTHAVPTGTIDNPSETAVRSGVKFRVNRGLIILNDLDTGSAWDVDHDKQKIDNWDAVIPPPELEKNNDKKDKNLVDSAVVQQPPTAEPDNLKVRAGRTSKLHVLDNDTDVAGSVLAIDPADVTASSNDKVAVSVAGDGQSIDASVPAGEKGTFTFTYKVGNGKATSAAAQVTVTIVDDSVNTPPHLRAGAQQLATASYPVLAGKRLSLPVVGDWRDDESDTVSVSTTDEATSVDGQGRLDYVAGLTPASVDVPYLVSDGRGDPTSGSARVEVIGGADTRARNPITQPDVLRGVVGKPLQIQPLANDIPGADPGDPDAALRLAGDVRAVGNLIVDTNRDTGVVTITPSAAGTFVLAYAAQMGSAVAPGRIRVDVAASPDPNAPPVAVSDTGTLRGQLPTMVDVLANDYSPRADVLVTQSVSVSKDNSWIEASVYQGRWVRLRALEPSGGGNAARSGTVTYVVSDGTHVARGQIDVVQRPVTALTPVVRDDQAIVREGDAVTIPVLDNDTMADGIPLRLDPLSVKVLDGLPQTAFASDNVVRFVPEGKALTADQHVTIEYAAYPEGAPQRAQTGRIAVTVTPLPTAARPNRAPVARSFTTSVTAGDPLTITVPTSGVDPDGDTVSIRGIVGRGGGAVALTLGRVVSIGPDTIRYEAYPNASGTEIIDYEVADRFGELSRAFVRVGVIAPGDPQPPVAVDDTVTAAPGKTVTIPVLQNDLIARGDVVTVSLAEDAKDWKVDPATHLVTTKVPPETAPLHHTVYAIDNGIFDPSRATILVRGQSGFINPPIAKDDVAKPKPGEESTLVDVLANDFDVDSEPGTLKIAQVLGEGATIERTADGPRVRVTITDHARTVPYVVEDEDGARGLALIHVPAGSKGRPYVPETALISMDQDATKTVALADYVKSPQGRVLGITAATTISSTPTGRLTVTENGPTGLTLTSSQGYVGPGAITLEVTDQTKADQTDVNTAYVTIPVQIGPKVPLLRCPSSAIDLYAGGRARALDIPTLCRAWLPQGMTMDDVAFTASWTKEPAGVDFQQVGTGDREVRLSAGASAPSGDGVLAIGVKGGSSRGEVTVRVIGRSGPGGTTPQPMPPPRLRPMSIAGLQEGQSQTVNVASYLDSPLANPQCTVESAILASGSNIDVAKSGCTVTVTAGKAPSMTGSITVTASDSPGRTATGSIDLTLLGKPGAPTAVTAQPDREAGGRARVAWVAPTYDGGSPIRTFTVRWTGGSSGSQPCVSSPCTIEGLTNGRDYTFTVTATNGVGEGDPSAASNVARPDTKPGPVGGVSMISRGDGSLTIGWSTPDNKGSAISKYTLRVIPTDGSGAARTVDVAAPDLSTVVSGLNNEVEYDVSAQAWNEVGAGPFGASSRMQSAGTPPAVAAPTLTPGGLGPTADLTTVDLAWTATRPNGPPLTAYTVFKRTGGGGWQELARVSASTFTYRDQVPVDGSKFDYVVTATNGAGITSPQANVSTFTAIGQPATPSVSASTPAPDKTVTMVVSLGNPHARGYSSVRWSSSGGGSGSMSCTASSCPAGGQVTIKTPALPTPGAQTMTVIASNGTSDSAPATVSASPFGPTPVPTNVNGSASGTTVTFSWSLPTDGRPITQVQVTGSYSYSGGPLTSVSYNAGYSATATIQVRSYSEAGWSGWSSPVSVRTPPPPLVLTVEHGTSTTNASYGCYHGSAITCFRPKVTVGNFGGTVSCSLFAPTSTPGTGYNDYRTSWTQPDNSTEEHGNYLGYYSYQSVQVTCSGPNGSKSVTQNWVY